MATFQNRATLTYNNGSTESNIVTGEINEVLTASKTALEETYDAGCPNTYLINIVNSGANAFTGLTVTDNLGAYTYNAASLTPLEYIDGSVRYFSNGVLQTVPTVTATSPLTISGISVPANGNVTIVYKARANEYAPLGETAAITNTASISGTALPNNIDISETVNHANEADLSVVKMLSPETVTENSEVTYTFAIQNRGSAAADAADNVAISDTFNPILSNITVTLDSVPLTEGTDYTYNTVTGLFQTTAGKITVPAATYAVDSTGAWSSTPGTAVLRVTGTI